ncbi:MAG TPA: TonB-dependent receptor [Lacunisphaera sp.]|nr:TonB-dependent receptor [Lacunisphaera sp.]
MSNRSLSLLTFLALAALAARAQTAAPPGAPAPAGPEGPAIALGKYVVKSSDHGAQTTDLITSVTAIGSDQLENESVDYPLELLNKVPGVYLTDFNQGIITADASLRGFNGEGGIPHVRLVVDGIPHNLNDGYNDLGAVFPLEIESIEVVKGTADPRFGLNAVAGSLNIHTHQIFSGQKLKVLAGDFGVFEAQGLAGFRRGGFSQTYFAGYRHSDGYRDHSELTKHSFAGKWFYTGANERWHLGLSARVHEFDADAPGYLSLADAHRTPTASPAFSSTDGGTMENNQFSLHGDVQLSPDLSASAKLYRHDLVRHRFVRFTAAGSQQERLADEIHTGVILNTRWKTTAGEAPVVIDAGAEFHDQDALSQRYATVERVRTANTRNQHFDLENTGAFVSAEVRPTPRLRLIGALRADHFDGEFVNRLNGARTPIIDYGTIWQPKFSASVQAHRTTQLYASYGRAFQIGSAAGAYGTTPLDPSKNDGYEVGVRTAPTKDLTFRLAAWRQTATDEVRLKFDNSGDSENVGETKRDGVDLEANWRAHERIALWAACTFQKGRIVNPGNNPADAVYRGKRIDHVPTYTLKAGADLTLTSAFTLAVSVTGQGDYYLTTLNTEGKFGDYLLTNLDLRYRWKQATFGLAVKNALDRYHEYVWHDGAQSLHSPGDARAFLGSVSLEF